MRRVRFFLGSEQSPQLISPPPTSLSIPSSLDDGVGLKLFKWEEEWDDEDSNSLDAPEEEDEEPVPGVAPIDAAAVPKLALSIDEAPDELELHDDEIIPVNFIKIKIMFKLFCILNIFLLIEQAVFVHVFCSRL